MANTPIFPVAPTKRVKATGARQEIINLIKAANPGTAWETVNWDDFNIKPLVNVIYDNEAFKMVNRGEVLKYPAVEVQLKNDKVTSYAVTSDFRKFRFTIENALTLDDVYMDVFGGVTEFTGVTTDELTAEIKKYIPNVRLKFVRALGDGSFIVNLETENLPTSSSNATELPFTSLIDCSEKTDPNNGAQRYERERINIILHPAKDAPEFNPGETNGELDYSNTDGIYEEAPAE